MDDRITELKLYCPLRFTFDSRDGRSSYEVDPASYTRYARDINEAIRESLSDDENERKYGLNAYTSSGYLAKKVYSIFPGVERRDGDLYGVFTVKLYGELDKSELADITKEIICHAADGWGESFGQHPVTLGRDRIYISFWNSNDGYFLKPESEVFPTQNFEQTMGGI